MPTAVFSLNMICSDKSHIIDTKPILLQYNFQFCFCSHRDLEVYTAMESVNEPEQLTGIFVDISLGVMVLV